MFRFSLALLKQFFSVYPVIPVGSFHKKAPCKPIRLYVTDHLLLLLSVADSALLLFLLAAVFVFVLTYIQGVCQLFVNALQSPKYVLSASPLKFPPLSPYPQGRYPLHTTLSRGNTQVTLFL